MIFKITNTACSRLSERYPILLKYGFRNEVESYFGGTTGMIVIDSLDDLVELVRDLQKEIIISTMSEEVEIEIYDGWRE